MDAAIVRIMKAKKTMLHRDLNTEAINALQKHFMPSVQDIKKRIDNLLEREYIERDEKNTNLYHYVA